MMFPSLLLRVKKANSTSIMTYCRLITQRNCESAPIDLMGLCENCLTALCKGRIEAWILQGKSSPPPDPDPAFEWEVVFHGQYLVTKNWKTNTIVTSEQIQEGVAWERRNHTCPVEEKQESSREVRDEYSFYPVAEDRVKAHNEIRVTGSRNHCRSIRTQDEKLSQWAQR